MNRVLITGANGLLGQKLVALFANTDTQILATARSEAKFDLAENLTFELLDITDAKACREIVQLFMPDAIINAAAMTQVDLCEDEQERCDEVNIRGVENLIQVIGNKQIHLLHISTDFIYQGDEYEYFEDSPAKPLSYYGKSKWKSEQLFQKANFPYTIFRTVLVYGVLDDLSRSNIVLWAKSSLERGEEISVVDDQYRCPTLAEDLALACKQAIEHKSLGVYHVSGKDFLSILELVFEIADFWGLDKSLINPIKTSSLNQKAKRPERTKLNIAKAKKEFNYQPRSFREGLEMVEEQLKNLKPHQ